MRTYKKRQKIWVKARYEADVKDDETECYVTINEHEDGDWMDAHDVRVRLADIRPRMKRGKPVSPWLTVVTPFTGPDKATVIVRADDGSHALGWWSQVFRRFVHADVSPARITHYMIIPPLEVK